MADKSNFNATVDALFKGMDSFVTTKTVVGEAMEVGNVTIVPLADVSFGIGAGAFAGNGKNNDGGGLGGKIRPAAILIIGKDGSTKLVRTDEKDGSRYYQPLHRRRRADGCRSCRTGRGGSCRPGQEGRRAGRSGGKDGGGHTGRGVRAARKSGSLFCEADQLCEANQASSRSFGHML